MVWRDREDVAFQTESDLRENMCKNTSHLLNELTNKTKNLRETVDGAQATIARKCVSFLNDLLELFHVLKWLIIERETVYLQVTDLCSNNASEMTKLERHFSFLLVANGKIYNGTESDVGD
jgi:hypothetical protein